MSNSNLETFAKSTSNFYSNILKTRKVISQEELDNLYQLSFDGDAKARNKLIEANLRLSYVLARKAYRKKYINTATLELDDIISFSNFGLIRACEKFNPNLGFKFSTYATNWINESIDRLGIIESNSVYLPEAVNKKLRIVKAIENKLSNKFGRKATHEEIATDANLSVSRVAELLSYSYVMNSGDEKLDQDSASIFEMLEDESSLSIEETIHQEQVMASIKAAINSDAISSQDRFIIKSQYGFDNTKELTLTEIGAAIGMSREGVRQRGLMAIETLRSTASFNENYKENINADTKQTRRAKAKAKLEALISGDTEIETIEAVVEVVMEAAISVELPVIADVVVIEDQTVVAVSVSGELVEETIKTTSEMLPTWKISNHVNSTEILLTVAPDRADVKVLAHELSRKLALLTAIVSAIGQSRADTSFQEYQAIAGQNWVLSATITELLARNIINDNSMSKNNFIVSTSRYNDKKLSWKEGSRRLTRPLPGQVNDYLSQDKVIALDHAYKANLDTISAIKAIGDHLAEALAFTSRKDFTQSNKEFNETWPCLMKLPERPTEKVTELWLASWPGAVHPPVFEATSSRTSTFNQIYSSA